ncbi:MAG: tyrosine-type recombinase/integrase [Eubacterium sp.]|nr:tyrosine-type recombinase/integrase [Eubacterium sp.]
MSNDYHKQFAIDQLARLREVISELPPYVKDYFRSINDSTQPRTRTAYAYNIKLFFEFLIEVNPTFAGKTPKDIDLNTLDQLTASDFEEYLDYLSLYTRNGRQYTNDASAKKRKLVALRSFFRYLYTSDRISQNVTEKVKTPKIHEKNIIRMDSDEVANFLDTVEFGNRLTTQQMRFHEKNKTRDLAMLTLMLSTGIRVSECIGINISDVDFDHSSIRVVRKGGNEDLVYFSDEAEAILLKYLEERKKIDAVSGSEDALFLSSRRTRMTQRNVEYLVKKYARVSTPLKKITPHKLRSTYGTALYQETGDIYLVASVLGHKDVNTTRKHYAALDDNKKWRARNQVQLRETDYTPHTKIDENPTDDST